ncbi:MAG: hypothetical protein E4H01_07865 [Lysobacterales bacterium]|nr:MAG: hypothetical protein E4H01_07865 [Xanthomonadales bacterium]
MRRSPKVDEVLPILYLRGLSTGDFREAIPALLGEAAAGLSATTITRLTNQWESEHEEFQKRDLSGLQDASARAPGSAKVVLRGARGTYPVNAGDDPPQFIISVGDGAAGICGETAFAPTDCAFNSKGDGVSCRNRPAAVPLHEGRGRRFGGRVALSESGSVLRETTRAWPARRLGRRRAPPGHRTHRAGACARSGRSAQPTRRR